MNYEDLLESRNGAAMAKESMPFGQLYKKMTDNKYANVVDLREDLLDSLKFCDGLSTECKCNADLDHKNQLHFTESSDSAGLYGVKVEQGTYTTFERLLENSPAIVARKSFITRTLNDLLDLTAYLHDHGIFHVCFAPNNVLARKSDTAAMLLFHGSAYAAIGDPLMLYGESARPYLAPEVLDGGVADARSDIYSLGRFMEFLYQQSEIPYELRGVVKKATDPDPDKRYQTPEEMRRAIQNRRSIRESAILGLAALLVVAICFSLYFTLVPEREDIEFVKPAPRQAGELGDDGFGSTPQFDGLDDSIGTNVDQKTMREYEAKAEQIFRKKFSREAERILSRIYNSEHMGSTSKNFMASSQSTLEELVKVQVRLGNEAGLDQSRSQLVASQIVEQITSRLKAKMEALEKAPSKEHQEEKQKE